tara:strand:- start:1496 stop:2494 length:999 start_codon:yes stop_codon:yes gene_type:complete
MASWKKIITSGSSAHLQAITTDSNISGSLTSTGSFGHIKVGGNDFSTAVSSSAAASGFGSGGGGGGSQNLFSTVAVSGQSDVAADSTTDTLTLEGGSGVTITTNSTTDKITFSSYTAAQISGSLGENQEFIRSLTGVKISGSFNTTSSSLASRVATNKNSIDTLNGKTLVSSSQQIGDAISGSFGNQRVGTTNDVTFASVSLTGNAVIAGDLIVTGSTISANSSTITDQFIFLASGSEGSNLDSGILIQSGSVAGKGSLLFKNSVGSKNNRWSITENVATGDTAVDPEQYVATVNAPELHNSASNYVPSDSDKKYGKGEIFINGDGEIFIYS